MSIRVAVNGFGRIGRAIARIASGRDDITVVAANDLTDNNTLGHLFKYDSVHGVFPGDVRVDGDRLLVDGESILMIANPNPAELPWDELGIDVVVECTGRFRTRELAAQHISAGAKRVIVSAPAKGVDATIVLGVNDADLDGEGIEVISCGSCTTNCLAPLARVLHESVGIRKGLMTTVHAYTSDQRLVDAPHKDLRRARSAALSMIPTTTGAAVAVTRVLPQLEGRLDGMAIRVPTPNVSLVDFVFESETPTSVEEINAIVKKAATGQLEGILAYSTAPVVSVDLNGNPHSSIFDAPLTKSVGGNLIKCLSWYDNEWGFSNRMVDLALRLAS